MRTQLYRHYDAAGTLLYVGISLCTASRLEQHMRSAGWFGEITSVKIEHFACRDDASAAEVAAIRKEKPLWNVTHNKRPVIKEYASRRGAARKTISTEPELHDALCFDGTYAIVDGQLIRESDGKAVTAADGEIRPIDISRWFPSEKAHLLACG